MPAAPGGGCAARSTGIVEQPLDADHGRGVLTGAFAVLDALAHADDGLGLTALARASGLAKTSAYRLAEQLVALGAVENLEHRYYVGPRLLRLGRHWQPDPRLRQVSRGPVHALAVQASCDMTALVTLDGDRLRVVSATSRRGCAYWPDALDRETVARTAAGRILYANRPEYQLPPGCWTLREWRRLRQRLDDPHATVAEVHDAVPGTCSVSAPVRYPNGDCAGAVFALNYASSVAKTLPGLVLCTALGIDAALAVPGVAQLGRQ